MSRIAILGNLGVDILYRLPRLPHQHEKVQTPDMTIAGGGAPANVAHWLARLGHEVSFHAVTGTDPLSLMAAGFLARAGVDVAGIAHLPDVGPSVASIFTGGTTKAMVCGGPRGVDPHWRALAARTGLAGVDHVHFAPSLHALLFEGGRRADIAGATVSTDLNGSVSMELLRDPDIAFTNEDELDAALKRGGAPDLAALLAEAHAGGTMRLIVTRGDKGVTCHRGAETVAAPSDSVTPVDRTGGGDAFAAGYLHARLCGCDDAAALRAGLRLARAALSGIGSRPETEDVASALTELARPA